MASHAHTNRLARETSPYLLQHAHNPVDWFAWGPEALETARRLDKPIFLSVGYSTCYWCHVMERQCFENEAIAAEMNRLFVNIKVDREERPDLDQLYMMTVQIMTRQGGWPMSVFLTPDLKPFFGGTYFPPEDNYGRPGFPRLLGAISDAYQNRRDEVERAADDLVAALRQMSHLERPGPASTIDEARIGEFIRRSVADFDPEHGGFGDAPKFPRETLLELLLVHLGSHADARIDKMVRISLDAMAHGGIRDHLGGGFHRYSTDARWLVPHFEIMLYDNAMLLWIYSQAYRQTGDERYAAVARGIGDFILREMTAPGGGFYTALDAEVDAQEGGNYLWTKAEVAQTLESEFEPAQIERFCEVYGLNAGPNFTDPHHSGGPKKNVLFLAEPFPHGKSALLDPELDRMRQALYVRRQKRKQPLLDTKILTSWNALMIRALGHAGTILREDQYIRAAGAAADFLLQKHRDDAGGLLRVSAGGPAKHAAFLDDYAFLAQALLELGRAGNDPARRQQATQISQLMLERFGDPGEGGLFYSGADASDLIARQKIGSDSPLPSGNAIAAAVLMELGQWEDAGAILSAFAGQLGDGAPGMSAMVQAGLQYVSGRGPLKISASGAEDKQGLESMARQALDVVRIGTRWIDGANLVVHCDIKRGFHLNAHQVSGGLIGTRLAVDDSLAGEVSRIDYPPAVSINVGDQSIDGYENELAIGVQFKNRLARGTKVDLALTVQPCDDKSCLQAVIMQISTEAP